jgi:hypothetical protein
MCIVELRAMVVGVVAICALFGLSRITRAQDVPDAGLKADAGAVSAPDAGVTDPDCLQQRLEIFTRAAKIDEPGKRARLLETMPVCRDAAAVGGEGETRPAVQTLPNEASAETPCTRHGYYLEPSLMGAMGVSGSTYTHSKNLGVLVQNAIGYHYRNCRSGADPWIEIRAGVSIQISIGNPPIGDNSDINFLPGGELAADWQVTPSSPWRFGPQVSIYSTVNTPLFGVGMHASYSAVTIELDLLGRGAPRPPMTPRDKSIAVAIGLRFGGRAGKYAMLIEDLAVLGAFAFAASQDMGS